MNDTIIISTILGIPLLLSYLSIFFKSKKEQNDLWTNNGSNIIKNYLETIYKGLVLLAFICGIYMILFLISNAEYTVKNKKINIFLSLLIIGSLLWLPTFYYFYSKILLRFILLFVAIMMIMLRIEVTKIFNDNGFLYFAMDYLIIHTMIFDFLIWSF